jgi:hypothetical protein
MSWWRSQLKCWREPRVCEAWCGRHAESSTWHWVEVERVDGQAHASPVTQRHQRSTAHNIYQRGCGSSSKSQQWHSS